MHDVRCTKGREPLLSHGVFVRTSRAKNSILEHYKYRAECFSVEDIVEGKSGQVTAVADEERLLDKLGVHLRATVLKEDHVRITKHRPNHTPVSLIAVTLPAEEGVVY